MGVEFVLLVLAKGVISRRTGFHLHWADLWYLAAGSFFVLGSMIFLRKGSVFATPDSLYLIVMSKSILETGSKLVFRLSFAMGVICPNHADHWLSFWL